MPYTNRASLLFLILLICNTNLFSQCEKEISTNPLNPIQDDSISKGETIRLLTEKVEELTLYLLQQQKEIEGLKAKLIK